MLYVDFVYPVRSKRVVDEKRFTRGVLRACIFDKRSADMQVFQCVSFNVFFYLCIQTPGSVH